MATLLALKAEYKALTGEDLAGGGKRDKKAKGDKPAGKENKGDKPAGKDNKGGNQGKKEVKDNKEAEDAREKKHQTRSAL